jgi:hypothetical protein
LIVGGVVRRIYQILTTVKVNRRAMLDRTSIIVGEKPIELLSGLFGLVQLGQDASILAKVASCNAIMSASPDLVSAEPGT